MDLGSRSKVLAQLAIVNQSGDRVLGSRVPLEVELKGREIRWLSTFHCMLLRMAHRRVFTTWSYIDFSTKRHVYWFDFNALLCFLGFQAVVTLDYGLRRTPSSSHLPRPLHNLAEICLK
jgi:hypothetical protein